MGSWRPEMGALHVACVGCRCAESPGSWAAAAYPFPTMQTWSYGLRLGKAEQKKNLGSANASLTVSTRFALLKGESDCFLNVTHVPGLHQARAATSAKKAVSEIKSRVRIDSLGLEVQSCIM